MKTDFPFINDFAVFSDGTVAVCGGKKIKCYNFESGKILSSTEMGFESVRNGWGRSLEGDQH